MGNYEVRQSIVNISKIMYNKGMVNAFEGNISVLSDNKVYITPSAVCKGFLCEDDIVVLDTDGNKLSGRDGVRPSTETGLHLEIYRKRNNKRINAVIHAHPPYSTAFAVAGKAIETKAYPELIILFGSVPVIEYGTPSTAEIYKGVADVICRSDVFLLSNHGIVSTGSDLTDVFYKLESVECMAKVLLLSNLAGGEKELPEDKINMLYKMHERFEHNRSDI